ncbi:unnamed protein product [Paramecium octaurelia]|uniref:Uncharacterized protein n=1 Tax=Paramecium octaurelia TaxID=43137 RepID=A0A8S1TN91_PAROT|nr:unnamed protein product [Paramecium octaurelia]
MWIFKQIHRCKGVMVTITYERGITKELKLTSDQMLYYTKHEPNRRNLKQKRMKDIINE